jgi:hypothetical protein
MTVVVRMNDQLHGRDDGGIGGDTAISANVAHNTAVIR